MYVCCMMWCVIINHRHILRVIVRIAFTFLETVKIVQRVLHYYFCHLKARTGYFWVGLPPLMPLFAPVSVTCVWLQTYPSANWHLDVDRFWVSSWAEWSIVHSINFCLERLNDQLESNFFQAWSQAVLKMAWSWFFYVI